MGTSRRFFLGCLQGRDVEFVIEDYVSNVAEGLAQDGFTLQAGLGRFGSRAADVEFFHSSIRAGLPVSGVTRGVFGGIIKKGVKKVTVLEGVKVARCRCILIETLRGTKGNLIHFDVWKRANVEKYCLGEKRNFSYFLTEKLMGASNRGSL